jgi:hypothetical protein
VGVAREHTQTHTGHGRIRTLPLGLVAKLARRSGTNGDWEKEEEREKEGEGERETKSRRKEARKRAKERMIRVDSADPAASAMEIRVFFEKVTPLLKYNDDDCCCTPTRFIIRERSPRSHDNAIAAVSSRAFREFSMGRTVRHFPLG